MVAHGNVIRYLVTKALGVDTTAWLEMSVHNASLTVIRVQADGRFKVIAVGDTGHLPPAMYTGATEIRSATSPRRPTDHRRHPGRLTRVPAEALVSRRCRGEVACPPPRGAETGT